MKKSPRLVGIFAGTALLLTACGGNGDGEAPDGEATGSVEVEAGDLYFDPEQLSASAGEVEITLVNVGLVEHDFVIEEANDTNVVHTDAGQTNSGTIELEAGSYTFYCTIVGHREAGMEGTLTVS